MGGPLLLFPPSSVLLSLPPSSLLPISLPHTFPLFPFPHPTLAHSGSWRECREAEVARITARSAQGLRRLYFLSLAAGLYTVAWRARLVCPFPMSLVVPLYVSRPPATQRSTIIECTNFS